MQKRSHRRNSPHSTHLSIKSDNSNSSSSCTLWPSEANSKVDYLLLHELNRLKITLRLFFCYCHLSIIFVLEEVAYVCIYLYWIEQFSGNKGRRGENHRRNVSFSSSSSQKLVFTCKDLLLCYLLPKSSSSTFSSTSFRFVCLKERLTARKDRIFFGEEVKMYSLISA